MTTTPGNALQVPKILCIEDDPIYARLLYKRLIRAGYKVDLEYSGQEGLKKALNHIYQVILIDYQLPDTDGLTIIETLAAEKNHPPMILLSSEDDASIVSAAMNAGAEDYIVKSRRDEDFDQVLATMDWVLEKRGLLNAQQSLGLALAHEIVVVEHQGSLTLDSEPGQYCQFTIRVPRTRKV